MDDYTKGFLKRITDREKEEDTRLKEINNEFESWLENFNEVLNYKDKHKEILK